MSPVLPNPLPDLEIDEKELSPLFPTEGLWFYVVDLSRPMEAPQIGKKGGGAPPSSAHKRPDDPDSSKAGPRTAERPLYKIGRFGEERPYLYTDSAFQGRTLHVGMDFGLPVGHPILAPLPGRVHRLAKDPTPNGFGHLVTLEHTCNSTTVYSLFGHVSESSLETLRVGDRVACGQCMARVGSPSENGGWPPHLHFQLQRAEPKPPFPGVVATEEGLQDFFDPYWFVRRWLMPLLVDPKEVF